MKKLEFETIGKYQIIEAIDEGGMGTVFLAEQKEPVHKQVAIKVLRSGVDNSEVAARFALEQKLLASMQHPNICQFYDMGTTDKGQPYIVMEWIPGSDILTYCNSRRLSVRERLQVFVKVCRAIHYAHQHGVIHRDIKPSNILVIDATSSHEPKVIDFGIAKAIGGMRLEKTLVTRHGQIFGTPEYMAPELLDYSGETIDTSADVYSLGIILYEMLVGRVPFEATGQSYSKFVDDVSHALPPEMRNRLLENTNPNDAAKARGGITLRRLQQLVSDELSWITNKAIQKRRRDRYASASELAMDVCRYLDGEMVEAQPPSLTYRLKVFGRRHRIAAIFSVAFAISLIVFSAILTVQVQRANHSAAVADAEATRATQSEQAAQQVSQFLINLFEASDPNETLGDDLPVKTVLDAGAEKIATEMSEQPALKSRLLNTMGAVYHQLGESEKSETMYTRSLEVSEQTPGIDPTMKADSLTGLGRIAFQRGEREQAESFYRQALNIQAAKYDQNSIEVAVAGSDLADALMIQGKYDDAREIVEGTLPFLEDSLDSDDDRVRTIRIVIAKYYISQQEFAKAEALNKANLDFDIRRYGEQHPSIGYGKFDLAFLYDMMGRYDDAATYYMESLLIFEKTLGAEHPNCDVLRFNLGRVYLEIDDLVNADHYATLALNNRRNSLGDENPLTIRSFDVVAMIRIGQDRLTEAEEILRMTLRRREMLFGPMESTISVSLLNLARVHRLTGKYGEASELLTRALALTEESAGTEDASYAETLMEVARLEQARNNMDAAVEALDRAIAINSVTLPNEHPQTVEALSLRNEIVEQ